MSSTIVSTRSRQIKGPSLPPFIQLFKWITNPLGYLENCTKRYGDTFKIHLTGFPPFIVVTDPEVIREIFRADAKNFDAGKGNTPAKAIFGENSLILMDGARHRRERKMLAPPFHGDRVKAHAKTICAIAKNTAREWQPGHVFIAQKVMQKMTFEMMVQIVFGLSDGPRYQQMKSVFPKLFALVSSPIRSSFIFVPFFQKNWGGFSPWCRFVRRRAKFYDLLQAEIDQRRSEFRNIGDHVLSLMLSTRDEYGQSMSDAELKDELMTLLVAGHETTATALTWSIYWIEKTPRVKDKLLAELKTIPPDCDPLEIAELPYLGAVCSEALRIYPVAIITFSRIAKYVTQIKNITLKPDDMIAPAIYLTHRREDIYPNPEAFIPERFIEKRYGPSEFFPFGGGSRGCIGYTLALLEMKLVLATLLSNYRFSLNCERSCFPKRRGSTVAPNNGVPMRFLGSR